MILNTLVLMKKKIAFIINPVSGNNPKKDFPKIITEHLDDSIFDVETVFTEYRFHGRTLTEQFVKAGYYAVVAVGGDGTVNEVARSLRHTHTALGIIPAGSGNGLARHLKIPMNVKKAVEHLNHAEPILMDYGLVNEQPFFCTCGTGFDAYVSTEFAKGKHRGIRTYLENIIKGFFKYKPEHYHLQGDGIDLKVKAFILTFANASQWGNNAYIAPQASVQDGKMDISILSNLPLISIPSLAIQLFTKTIDKDFLMTTLRTESVKLYRNAPGPFHYDGEPYEEGKKITIKMVPDGLRVLVKKRF